MNDEGARYPARLRRPKRCSNAGRRGQWAAVGLALTGLALTGLATGPSPSLAAAAAPPLALQPSGRPTPSGLPVPRYVSTKGNEANARGGPGEDYRVLWTYHQKGLPLQVIAETDEWRRVCDPEGGVSWLKKTLVVERRQVMRTQTSPAVIRRRPAETAAAAALLSGRALAGLQTCEHGWCRVAVGHVRGWVRADEVWGAAETAQCR